MAKKKLKLDLSGTNIATCLVYAVIGILLVALKGGSIGYLMTAIGALLILLGVVDIINGKEVVKPTGPFKLINEFGYESYYKRFNFRIGLLVPSWKNPCPFAGELGDFTCYGRALSEKEIQALAKGKVK